MSGRITYTSTRNKHFNKALAGLPAAVQKRAEEVYRLWKSDPTSAGFKRLVAFNPLNVWTVGFTSGGTHYRALAVRTGTSIRWFWIGSHEEYNKLYSRGKNIRGMNESLFEALADEIISA